MSKILEKVNFYGKITFLRIYKEIVLYNIEKMLRICKNIKKF